MGDNDELSVQSCICHACPRSRFFLSVFLVFVTFPIHGLAFLAAQDVGRVDPTTAAALEFLGRGSVANGTNDRRCRRCKSCVFCLLFVTTHDASDKDRIE